MLKLGNQRLARKPDLGLDIMGSIGIKERDLQESELNIFFSYLFFLGLG